MQQSNTGLAEVRFPKTGLSVMGNMVKLETHIAELALPHVPKALVRLPLQEAGELLLVLKGLVYHVNVIFEGLHEDRLLLSIGGAVYMPQQRRRKRIPLQIKAPWRSFHPPNTFGAWHNGVTQDISLHGMRLLIVPLVAPPAHIEATLHIVEHAKPSPKTPPPGLASPMLVATTMTETIRVRGVVRYSKPTHDGRLALGIFFTRISDVDQLRLGRLFAEKCSEIDALQGVSS